MRITVVSINFDCSAYTEAKPLGSLVFQLFLTLMLVGCSTTHKDYERGKADAERDIREGHFVYWVGGLPLVSGEEQARLLQKRYGVERKSVGCSIDQRLSLWLRGYRSVANIEIERRFGTNIWGETEAEAEKIYGANRKE